MLYGNARITVDKAEIVHAVDNYFWNSVRDEKLNPYGTVVDVREVKDGRFEIYLVGKPVEKDT
jgi:hypothetical protein